MFGNLESPLQNKMSHLLSRELWTRYMNSKSAVKLPVFQAFMDLLSMINATKSPGGQSLVVFPRGQYGDQYRLITLLMAWVMGASVKSSSLQMILNWEKWLADQKDLLPSRGIFERLEKG